MPTSQQTRVAALLQQLHEAEAMRRMVTPTGAAPDPALHNQLANQIRNAVQDMPTGDLRSLALRMIVDSVNGDRWPRCTGCGRPTYIGHA